MTKAEAIQALSNGSKLRHRYFDENEWMIQVDQFYKFEDGAMVAIDQFWKDRTNRGWEDGYELVE